MGRLPLGGAPGRRAGFDRRPAFDSGGHGPGTLADDFSLPHRDELSAALDPDSRAKEQGPYTRAAAQLVTSNATLIRSLLGKYDLLAQDADRRATCRVLTHGEPHPGNTMRAADGWLLIDWDTALLAPPERDLWRLALRDESVLASYADATGFAADPSVLALYRIGWDLADLAAYVNEFHAPHSESPNSAASWTYMRRLVGQLAA